MRAIALLCALIGAIQARPGPAQFPQKQDTSKYPYIPQNYQQNYQPVNRQVQQYQTSPNSYARITRYDKINDLGGPGGFFFHIETSDGFRHQATGKVKPVAPQQPSGTTKTSAESNDALEVEGEYSYLGPDGVVYTVYYLANENGFQPAGEHLPPAASTSRKRPQLGIPSAALASLAGGGLG